MSTIKSDVGRSWAFSRRNESNRVDASNASNSQVGALARAHDFDDRTDLASVSLVDKVTVCQCGPELHTGKTSTLLLFV